MPQKLTDEIINAAIEGFESQKRRIDSQIADLRQLLNGNRTEVAGTSRAPARKRRVSAAGRRRMAAAQKARWAKIRGDAAAASSPAVAKPVKRRRKLSAAGRKAISEATKRRWALKTGRSSEATINRCKEGDGKKDSRHEIAEDGAENCGSRSHHRCSIDPAAGRATRPWRLSTHHPNGSVPQGPPD